MVRRQRSNQVDYTVTAVWRSARPGLQSLHAVGLVCLGAWFVCFVSRCRGGASLPSLLVLKGWTVVGSTTTIRG